MAKIETAFGTALRDLLARRKMSQGDLARRLGRSSCYMCNIIAGRKAASPVWIDDAAARLGLSSAEERALHRAAAIDAGYRIG